MVHRLLIAAAASLVLWGCSAAPTVQMRSIFEPVPPGRSQPDVPAPAAAFTGLERVAMSEAGTIDANIFMVHGIGWTQKITVDEAADALPIKEMQFGFDLVKTFALFYGVDREKIQMRHEDLCPHRMHQMEGDLSIVTTTRASGGLKIMGDGVAGGARQIGCLDRIEFVLGAKGSVRIYRLFWDEAFYDAFEYSHLGYDDSVFSGEELQGQKALFENIEAGRAPDNRKFKGELVTYGLTDAAMYIGPAGVPMRDAVRAGLCAAIDDATRHRPLSAVRGEGPAPSPGTLCAQAPKPSAAVPFSVIAASLGSRIVFDVLTGRGTELEGPGAAQGAAAHMAALAGRIGHTRGADLEVYLLANQIPLIGTGMGTPFVVPTASAVAGKTLRFVAFSEKNDLLTYELVPYVEHLYFLQCGDVTAGTAPCPQGRQQHFLNFNSSVERRQAYAKVLGFELVDVRLGFAKPVHFLVPDLIDPLEAHTGYLGVRDVQHLILCGAAKSRVRSEGCVAQRP